MPGVQSLLIGRQLNQLQRNHKIHVYRCVCVFLQNHEQVTFAPWKYKVISRFMCLRFHPRSTASVIDAGLVTTFKTLNMCGSCALETELAQLQPKYFGWDKRTLIARTSDGIIIMQIPPISPPLDLGGGLAGAVGRGWGVVGSWSHRLSAVSTESKVGWGPVRIINPQCQDSKT
jgi:hypothetical protein